jgi:hypothetical protein
LPTDWIDLFIQLDWLDIVQLANGWDVWKPIDADTNIRDQWLPDHLRD